MKEIAVQRQTVISTFFGVKLGGENIITRQRRAKALKWRAVRGDAQPLYFWRDNIGNEIDVLLEQDGQITLVEVKSGQTFASDWLRGLETVERHMGHAVRKAVLYGGDTSMPRTQADVVGWRDVVLAG